MREFDTASSPEQHISGASQNYLGLLASERASTSPLLEPGANFYINELPFTDDVTGKVQVVYRPEDTLGPQGFVGLELRRSEGRAYAEYFFEENTAALWEFHMRQAPPEATAVRMQTIGSLSRVGEIARESNEQDKQLRQMGIEINHPPVALPDLQIWDKIVRPGDYSSVPIPVSHAYGLAYLLGGSIARIQPELPSMLE
ncbi:MAG TPA: hypothetical protein VJP80_04055 [Candidatus Saccharimonadales bacterium]|nr:hypothetical protein [Candidatus Saccharimonadales bacterium]